MLAPGRGWIGKVLHPWLGYYNAGGGAGQPMVGDDAGVDHTDQLVGLPEQGGMGHVSWVQFPTAA